MIKVDLHLHTSHSHGQDGVAAMYAASREKGLEMIGFSEHSPRPSGFDYPRDYRQRLHSAYPQYLAEVREIQAHDPNVLLGLELDWIPACPDFMESTINAYQYDYIIAGIHFLGTLGFDYSAADWSDPDSLQYSHRYEAYYETMADMAASGLFHIVAHPDLIKLFSREYFTSWLASDRGKDCVLAALESVRDADMAMEVSSAGLRKPCGEIYPAPPIMAMAAELGIPISFGSDAHCVNTPAFAFADLAAYAHAFGYEQSVYFRKGTRFFCEF